MFRHRNDTRYSTCCSARTRRVGCADGGMTRDGEESMKFAFGMTFDEFCRLGDGDLNPRGGGAE